MQITCRINGQQLTQEEATHFSSFRLEIKCCLYQIIISRFWLRHSNDPRKIIFKYYFAPYKLNNKLL